MDTAKFINIAYYKCIQYIYFIFTVNICDRHSYYHLLETSKIKNELDVQEKFATLFFD